MSSGPICGDGKRRAGDYSGGCRLEYTDQAGGLSVHQPNGAVVIYFHLYRPSEITIKSDPSDPAVSKFQIDNMYIYTVHQKHKNKNKNKNTKENKAITLTPTR